MHHASSWKGSVTLLIFLVVLAVLIVQNREQIARGLARSRHKKADRDKVSLDELLADLEKENSEEKPSESSPLDSGEAVTIEVPECGCSKIVAEGRSDESVDLARTTCGSSAHQRGAGQKTFAYSFYGEGNPNRKYFDGIELNAAAVAERYPDWTVRVYHNLTDADGTGALCDIACRHSNVDLCPVSRNPMLGDSRWILPTMWRFLALVDEQVEVANFRDLDSVLSARESAAVDAWLRSKHPVHIMRDHPNHDMPILAGMWGAKTSKLRNTWRRALLTMLRDPGARPPHLLGKHGASASNDQFLLEFFVWPWAEGRSLQHDSYTCGLFRRTTPWPTKREESSSGNYVGAPFAEKNTMLDRVCPLQCRPRDHKEWTKC